MTLRKLFLASLLLAGCSTDMTDEPLRGPIGKADVIGTCSADTCGGPAEVGNCWCDDACAAYGDCCANKVEACEPAQPAICGGFAGFQCDASEYCHYDSDATCGAADQTGTCLPLPEACIEIFSPVCGCDGQDYGNECFAHMAGTSVASTGECHPNPPPLGTPCGGFLGLGCGEDQYCHYDESEMCGAADQMGTCQTVPEVCITLFDPVCGCDGQEYSNGCFANAGGTSVAHTGGCN